jgi:hypothetical protein
MDDVPARVDSTWPSLLRDADKTPPVFDEWFFALIDIFEMQRYESNARAKNRHVTNILTRG